MQKQESLSANIFYLTWVTNNVIYFHFRDFLNIRK